MAQIFRVGFLLFPDLTQLDLTGPYEVLSKLPGGEMHLVWKNADPVRADSGLQIVPTTTFAACPPLDLLCVPGGPGINQVLTDAETLDFIRRMAGGARYVTSVCTGSLALGAAGLLRGRNAASHWMSRHMLAEFGAMPTEQRVVVDGNIITGGGVTAGIDFGLRVLAELAGADVAEIVQLLIEYDPEPPFKTGSPRVASPALVERVRGITAERQRQRAEQVQAAAAALNRKH